MFITTIRGKDDSKKKSYFYSSFKRGIGMKIYTIELNGITIGNFTYEKDRDNAFEKFVKPNLTKKDNFLKGMK